MPATVRSSLLFILVEEDHEPWPAARPFAIQGECGDYRGEMLLCIVASDHVRMPRVMERADWELYGVPGNAIVGALKTAVADTQIYESV
jgi:hypothetical protein